MKQLAELSFWQPFDEVHTVYFRVDVLNRMEQYRRIVSIDNQLKDSKAKKDKLKEELNNLATIYFLPPFLELSRKEQKSFAVSNSSISLLEIEEFMAQLRSLTKTNYNWIEVYDELSLLYQQLERTQIVNEWAYLKHRLEDKLNLTASKHKADSDTQQILAKYGF